MEFSERQMLVRRVVSGIFYGEFKYSTNTYQIKFSDPSLNLLTEADYRYSQTFDNLKGEGEIITLEESYELLKKDGIWSDKYEEELIGLYKDIQHLTEKLPSMRFQKMQERAIKKTIEDGKKRIEDLENTKNQLWPITINYMAERAKKRFIIKNITTLFDMKLLSDNNFIDALHVYYYNNALLSQKQIRELARTDPWRLYWTVSRDTSTPLFPHSCVETTELQYALLLWTRIYDFAYENPNRPTDDIIIDDDKFDLWYRQEANRIDAELKKNSTERAIGNIVGTGGQETFIPADEEGAKEVYGLNNPLALSRIKQRENALIKHGELKESELPDVSKDLKMELNRLASEGIKNRSR